VCHQCGNIPSSLEDSEQPSASQHTNTKSWHDAGVVEDRFDNTTQHDETVEAIEQRHEVALQAETVHLEQHLHREQPNEEQVRDLYQRQHTTQLNSHVFVVLQEILADVYTMSQKTPRYYSVKALPNVGRFSQFFRR